MEEVVTVLDGSDKAKHKPLVLYLACNSARRCAAAGGSVSSTARPHEAEEELQTSRRLGVPLRLRHYVGAEIADRVVGEEASKTG